MNFKPKTTPTYIKSEALDAMISADKVIDADRRLHMDLILRNQLGELSPEEQAYYDAWKAELVANADEEEEDED